ncbi:hypothetical protein SEA_WILDWEST_53 [Arthrobacter phage Wildwest]|uniref:Uncharacterized protein n=1 Tax=Arthrobacter phage Wildwest TaxID=3051767 RepID=A0AA96KIH9_9CAUD|nr:hypothetical protein SEA_WILDWEST_53 [Arthrobacter phage Wildwest]
MNNTPAPAPSVDEAPAPLLSNVFQRRILAALNIAQYPRLAGPGRLNYGHIFAGIDPAEKAKRRAKGKAQRLARRKHR